MVYPYRPISPDSKDVPRILKVRGGAAYRVFGRLSVRVNTRQCPPFVRPVYRRCLPNKSLYTVGASLSLRAPPLPHANDTPSCLWNRRPLYKGGGHRDERRVNGDAKYFTMEHVRAHRPRRRSTRRVERTRHRAYAYSGWRLRDELLGNVGPSLINDGTDGKAILSGFWYFFLWGRIGCFNFWNFFVIFFKYLLTIFHWLLFLLFFFKWKSENLYFINIMSDTC